MCKGMPLIGIAFKYLIAYRLFVFVYHHAKQYLRTAFLAIFAEPLLAKAALLLNATFKIQCGNIIEYNVQLLVKHASPFLEDFLLDHPAIIGQFVQGTVQMLQTDLLYPNIFLLVKEIAALAGWVMEPFQQH